MSNRKSTTMGAAILCALALTLTGCAIQLPATPVEATPVEEPAPEPPVEEPAVEEPEEATASVDRGAILYADIQDALDLAGEERTQLRMFAVTDVTDEGSYLRVHYQNPIASKDDAEDLVREIYGFTASDAFIDGERNTIVVRDASGLDTNVWVTRNGLLAQFSTSVF